MLGAVGAAAVASVAGCLDSTTARGECDAGKLVSRLHYRGAKLVPGGTTTEADVEALAAALGPGVVVTPGEQVQDRGASGVSYLVRGRVGTDAVREACSAVGLEVASLEPLEPGPPAPPEVFPERRRLLDDASADVPLPEFTTYEGADAGFATFPGDVESDARRVAEAVMTEMGLLQVAVVGDDRVTRHRAELTPETRPGLRETSDGEYLLVASPHQYPFDTWTDGEFSSNPSAYEVRWFADGRPIGEYSFAPGEVRAAENGGIQFGEGVTVELGPLAPAVAGAVYAAAHEPLSTALRAERLC